ncbi:hypothetical protein GW17_00060930, partial [Ensete ventricosum]
MSTESFELAISLTSVSFTQGIGKLAGNTLGDHREKTRRLTVSMPEAIRLVE